MASFFKGNTLFREDSNGNYLKVNDIIPTNHWKLQETSGTDANDGGSNPETLQNVNVTINQTGKIDKCYDFDGSGQRLRSTYVPTGTTGSFCFWVNIDAFDNCAIISSSDESSTNYYWSIRFVASNIIQLLSREGLTSFTTEGTTTLSTGTWYHFAIIGNGSSYTVYIDGVEEILAGDNDGKWFGDISNRDNFVIGAFQRTSVSGGYNGRIEDVRLYDYPLTAQEIATIYNAGNGTLNNSLLKVYPTSQEPTNHWKLQEESGTDVNDSGNEPSTLTNTDSTVNQVGKIDKAYSFNGTSSRLTFAQTLKSSSNGTLCAWIKPDSITSDVRAIATESDGGTSNYLRFYTFGGKLRFNLRDSGAFIGSVETPEILNDTEWHHVAVVARDSEYELYINGVSQTLSGIDGTLENTGNWTDTITVTEGYIGAFNATGSVFDGLIEDVRYYDYVLSEQEIKNIYNQGKGLLL